MSGKKITVKIGGAMEKTSVPVSIRQPINNSNFDFNFKPDNINKLDSLDKRKKRTLESDYESDYEVNDKINKISTISEPTISEPSKPKTEIVQTVETKTVSSDENKKIQEFKELTSKFFDVNNFSQTDYDSLKEIEGLNIRGLELPDKLAEMLYNENPLAFSTYYGNDEETKELLGINNPNMNGITPNEYMLNKTIHELTLMNDNYFVNLLNCNCDNVEQSGGVGPEDEDDEEYFTANEGEEETTTASSTIVLKNPNGMLAKTIPEEARNLQRIKKDNMDTQIIDPIRAKGYQDITFSDIIKYIYAQKDYVNDTDAYDGFIKNVMFGGNEANVIPFAYITYTPSETKKNIWYQQVQQILIMRLIV